MSKSVIEVMVAEGAQAYNSRPEEYEWGLMVLHVEGIAKPVFGRFTSEMEGPDDWPTFEVVRRSVQTRELEHIEYPLIVDPARIVALRYADGEEISIM
jgi:hypothetical protein